MKKIDIEQRSTDWHEYRKNKIGASMIGSILGVNPYQSPLALYEEMNGIRPPREVNKAMQKGNVLEEIALHWAEKQLQKTFSPAVVEHESFEHDFASLDGLSWDEDCIVEIKCSRKLLELARQNIVPEMYIYQMQWQLYVTGLEKAYYVAFDLDETGKQEGHIIEFGRETPEFIQKMVDEAYGFYLNYINGIPPAASEDDHVKLNVEFNNLAYVEEYLKIIDEIKVLKEEEERLKTEITSWGDDGNMILCYQEKPLLKMTRVQRDGTVDWQALCASKGISEEDIKPFKKKQVGYWKLSKIK